MLDDSNNCSLATVSVIIPCKNEEASILGCLQQDALKHAFEVIVVDGGSSDSTLTQIAQCSRPLTLLHSEKANRAAQMNLAASQARGAILLFLHADTQLPSNAISEIASAVASGIGIGCFRRRFTPHTTLLDFTSRLAYWRSKWLFWSYGDQAIFVRSDVLGQLGYYLEMPYMEDLDLCLRAKKHCRYAVLDSPIQTSARRFADAPLKRLLKDLALSLGYITGLYRPR